MARRELTTGEVARVLSVSEATVKRWADRRLLLSEKTAGGHRRFRTEAIARFLRDKNSPERTRPEPSANSSPVSLTEQLSRAHISSASTHSLFESLLDGRADDAAPLLINLYLHGRGLEEIFDQALAPAMRRVGDLWHTGDLSIAQEHLATRTAEMALERLRDVVQAEEGTGLLAVCCGMEGDFHDLAVRCAHALLESKGWQVVNLGANTPFFALTEAMLRHGPALVCVSSAIFTNPDRAAREYEEVLRSAARLRAAIVLGGAGFQDEQVRQRFYADLHAENFRQLAVFTSEIAAAPRA
jgi:excisionase family DNA binding protein